jgi:hypothetical protein
MDAYDVLVQLNDCLPFSCSITISVMGLYFRILNKVHSPYSMELCSGIYNSVISEVHGLLGCKAM